MIAGKSKHPELSKAEFDILRVLWKAKRLSVREVHDQLQPVTNWAYSTTKTMMDRMVQKGLMIRESFHGIFLYRPLISRPAGMVRMIQFVADRVLEMDYSAVVALFAHSNTLTQEEIDELERFLENESKKGSDQ